MPPLQARNKRALVVISVAFGAGAALVSHGCSAKQPAQEDTAPVAMASAAVASATPATAGKAFHRPAGTGRAYWGPGDMYTFLATGEETNGAFFQFEALVPPGGGPPPHIHTNKDESFYIVAGTLEMHLGDAVITAKSGDFVNVPKGTLHGFKNVGTEQAKMLALFVPAGFEHYFEEVCEPVKDRNAAPPPVTDAFIQKMVAAAPKHDCQILLPETK